LDPENIFALEGLAMILYKTGRSEEALDVLMDLIESVFFFPRAHALIGEILFDAEYFDKAVESFEVAVNMNPKDIKSRKRLVSLYGVHCKNETKLTEHTLALEKLIQGEITIVTGLPRSGTSLVMQLLAKAGMEIFCDSSDKGDEFNPKGYFESSLVRTLSYDKSWLEQAKGKAMKIPCDLMEYLPDRYNYKIIYVTRDFNEILKSTLKTNRKLNDTFLNSFPTLLAESYSRYDEILSANFSSRADLKLLNLNFNSLMNEPDEEMLKLIGFLGHGQIQEMCGLIDSNLYQTRLVNK
jgi:tetratricopeptide (TPR) repeat protein